jgi:hypothetical protein
MKNLSVRNERIEDDKPILSVGDDRDLSVEMAPVSRFREVSSSPVSQRRSRTACLRWSGETPGCEGEHGSPEMWPLRI